MSSTMKIGGVEVDLNNPCDVLLELRKAQITVATGEAVSVARFGEDETRFTEANVAGLEKLITLYDGLCHRSQGKSYRQARTVRWGRH